MATTVFEIERLGASGPSVWLSLDQARRQLQSHQLSSIDKCREKDCSEWTSLGEHHLFCKYVTETDDDDIFDAQSLENSGVLQPLSDIAFLLLIFFLVNFVTIQFRSIHVPETSDSRRDIDQKQTLEQFGGRPKPVEYKLVLRIDEAGHVSIDDVLPNPTHYVATKLEKELKLAAEKTGAKQLVICHSPTTNYEDVVNVINSGLKVPGLKVAWQKAETNEPSQASNGNE